MDPVTSRRQSPINRAACEQIIWNLLEGVRPALVGKKTRIAASSYTYLESRVRNIIEDEITRLPSVGQTIKLGDR